MPHPKQFFQRAFSFFVIAFTIIFLNCDNIAAVNRNSRYINIIVDEELYYPISEIADIFAKSHEMILNMKFVKNNFYSALKSDNSTNVFITRTINKQRIENVFEVKSNKSIWQSSFGICGSNAQIEKIQNNKSAIKKILRRNAEYLELVEELNDSFIFEDIDNIHSAKRFDNSVKTVNFLKSKVNNLALMPTHLCNSSKNLFILNFEGVFKMPITEYRIFAVNRTDKNVEAFVSFITNYSQIIDILKKYNLIKKVKQFHG